MMAPLQKRRNNELRRTGLLLVALGLMSCTVQSSLSNHYLTAEKLWMEKNYRAAAAEFDRVVKEAPNSAVGLQALWRSTMTRDLFLAEPEEALKGYELFLERAGESDLKPQAQVEIGEILFVKLAQYSKAIDHYQRLLSSGRFGREDQSRFVYRIARSYFLLHRLKTAIEWYERGIQTYPDASLISRMKLDLANAWYALGEVDRQAYAKALKLFRALQDPAAGRDRRLVVESIFGEASTLEEQEDFEGALVLFRKIEADYPAPNVIRVRIFRLQERMRKKTK